MLQIISEIIKEYARSIISIIVVYYLGKIILDQKYKNTKKNFFIAIQIILMIYTIICLNINGLAKTIMLSIINVIFYKNIFKVSILKSILLMFIYTIMSIIADLLNLFFVTEILGFSKTFCYEVYAGSIVGNIVGCSITIVVVYILRKQLRKILNTKISDNTKIVTLSVLTLISILLFFYTIIKEFKFNNNIIIYLVSIFVMMLVLISLIKQTIRNNKLIQEYDKLLEFMITFENEIENQRVLRHEIKNEFRTVRAKIVDNQENKEIIAYIDEIVNDKYEMDKEKYAKFGYLPPNGIKGLCYFKTQEAEEKGIKVALNISKRIKDSSIYQLNIKEQRDFGRILGVFLDNAIEASMESQDKKIGIEAYSNSEKEFKIIITNTHNNTIDKNKIGKESFSTKGKTRGHGLLLVKQLVGKNEIFEIKTDIQEKLYIQTIIVKKL